LEKEPSSRPPKKQHKVKGEGCGRMWKSGWCGGGLGWIKGAEGDDGYFVKVCKKWQTFWCFKKLIKKDLTREVRKLSIFILFPFYIFMATCEEFANPRNPPLPHFIFTRVCVWCVLIAGAHQSASVWVSSPSSWLVRICGLNFNGDWWRLYVCVHWEKSAVYLFLLEKNVCPLIPEIPYIQHFKISNLPNHITF